jgi:putative ABC transport system substrate-binding protein
MKRAAVPSILVAVMLLAVGVRAEAQQPTKIPRIGYLSSASAAATSFRTEPFRRGLRERGYVEGKNIVVEYRYAEGKLDRLPALAAELVRLRVDVIVTAGPVNTRAAKKATDIIPIVMTEDPDPVGSGFVGSLARPGGNITGLSTLTPEVSGKRLELLKATVPRLARVAVLGGLTNRGNAQALKEIELAAGALGIKVQPFDIQNPKDIETAFREASKARADAVLTLNLPPYIETRIATLAVKNRLPAIYYESAIVVEKGEGLMSYGVSLADLDRRAATYVDKILKGAKPADLPLEQPTKLELVINLKTAKQIGLTIPPDVLARADRVIK